MGRISYVPLSVQQGTNQQFLTGINAHVIGGIKSNDLYKVMSVPLFIKQHILLSYRVLKNVFGHNNPPKDPAENASSLEYIIEQN